MGCSMSQEEHDAMAPIPRDELMDQFTAVDVVPSGRPPDKDEYLKLYQQKLRQFSAAATSVHRASSQSSQPSQPSRASPLLSRGAVLIDCRAASTTRVAH